MLLQSPQQQHYLSMEFVMKFFNTAGPIKPNDHYFVPARLDDAHVRILIEQKKYFILHAPRQSGKTTAIRILIDQLNAEEKYTALYVNVEAAQAARGNVRNGLNTILGQFKAALIEALGAPRHPIECINQLLKETEPRFSTLHEFLQDWCMHSDKPIILFIDEIDSLVGDTLISVLRQIRAGYPNRPEAFPQAICLIGVRDVRDYRIWSEEQGSMVLGGSAFNIKAESLVLENFSRDQVRYLYEQHTKETGQVFTDEAIEYAFSLTQGQPWLVNALAYQACFRDVTDRSKAITKAIIERSKEVLIQRRDTHIDVLIDRLAEPRVRHIIDAIVGGAGEEEVFNADDLQYVRDLGLIAQKGIGIANPIYQEIIPRELAYAKQESIAQQTSWYITQHGALDTHKLLEAFTQFFRENSEVWLERFAYKESGPHLLLMAFLQRVINGGGRIHREYALGRKRLDLLIEWQQQRIVLELKVKRGNKTLADGLEQTAWYMDTNNATEGHLIIFDRSKDRSWDEKISVQEHIVGGKVITVWCM